MTISKNYQGAWVIYSSHNGQLITMTYMGYTKKQAINRFKEHLRGIK